ncbi:MAG: peptide deformylase [Bacteroidales bacterium]|nr:peptide deformylase [Bacteroidales bacterium]MCF8327268.1 peptide deformylase [Bacteroidales bacterium]
MILPVTAYGHPTLRKKAEDIDQNYENLDQLIGNMFETMHYANGIGLAAPQVNLPIRLFLIDATPYENDIPEAKDFKKVFINAEIVDKRGEELNMEEGCLSIPGIHEEVTRPGEIHIKYYDENWTFHDEKYSGMIARIIQHEYDHIEGILFPDRLSTLRKTLIRGKLKDIAYGKVDPGYKMLYPKLKKKTAK